MIVDVHRHIVVPEVTGEAGGDEPWRPSVRWEDGDQVVELGGQVIRSAVREFVRLDRILEEETSSEIDHVVLSPWVNLLGYALEPQEALHVARLQNEALSAASEAHAGRVSAFGAVPLHAPDLAAQEVEALMRLPGIRGVEVAAGVAAVNWGRRAPTRRGMPGSPP